MKSQWKKGVFAGLMWIVATLAFAQDHPSANTPSSTALMRQLDKMKGVWIGEAKGIGADGKPYVIRQTERVGAMLDGDVLVIEGRGYASDGKLNFNAFGIISANSKEGNFEFRAYNRGRSGTYKMRLVDGGVVWELPLGPNALVRYTITLTDDTWHEIGEYIAAGQEPRRTIDIQLKRTRDTDWPAAQAVLPE